MNAPVEVKLQGQQFWMSGERTLFWEEKKTLILSDLHLGKTGHFRKAGIPVPGKLYKNDLHRLMETIQYFQPHSLVFVGDLTHSYENQELDQFRKWREDLPNIRMELVKGNHDVLSNHWYESAGIEVHAVSLSRDSFLFVHDPLENEPESECYLISGHLHPGVIIRGLGKQSLRFPCFHFGPRMALLPAFSEFTGLACIERQKDELQYAIVEKNILPIQ